MATAGVSEVEPYQLAASRRRVVVRVGRIVPLRDFQTVGVAVAIGIDVARIGIGSQLLRVRCAIVVGVAVRTVVAFNRKRVKTVLHFPAVGQTVAIRVHLHCKRPNSHLDIKRQSIIYQTFMKSAVYVRSRIS